MERVIFINTSFQNYTMPVRIVPQNITICLMRNNCCTLLIYFSCTTVIIIYDRKYDLWNIFEEVPVIFEIGSKQFGDGKYKLAVREFQEHVFWEVFREKQESFLVATWAEVPAFARERSKIFMAAVRIGTLNPGNTFWIVSTFNELLYCLLDTYYSVFAILICIMIVVALLKIREVVFKNGLNNIPASGFIDRYMGVHTMFKQERQEEISFNS